MGNINTLKVNIYGMEFTLRSQDDPKYLEDLVKFVDGRIRELAVHTKAISTANLAILAALNIADEYFKAQKEWQEKKESASQKVSNVLHLIEKVEAEG